MECIHPFLTFIIHHYTNKKRIGGHFSVLPTAVRPGTCLFLASNERQEHVEGDLDRVDKDKTVLVGDELEVNGVYNGPHLPGSLAGSEEVVLDLLSDHRETVTIDKSQVGEEDSHEAWAPEKLVNSNLEGDILGFLTSDQVVEPVVEVVSRRSVVDETKERKRQETLHVKGSSDDKDLVEYNRHDTRESVRKG